jgi:hypothetical protein
MQKMHYSTTYFEVIGVVPAGATQIPNRPVDDTWFGTPLQNQVGTMFGFGDVRVPVSFELTEVQRFGEVRAFRKTAALDTLFASDNWQARQWFRGTGALNSSRSAALPVTSGTFHGCKNAQGLGWDTDWVAAETMPGATLLPNGRGIAFQKEDVESGNNGRAKIMLNREYPAQRKSEWRPP